MPYYYSLLGRLLLGAGLLAGPALRAGAQTVPADTTRLQYSEEVATPPATDAPLRVQREERSLWKLGLNNFLWSCVERVEHRIFGYGSSPR